MNNIETPYLPSYYDRLNAKTWTAAQAVVPLVLEATGARRVVDVGCGSGVWLSVFKENGVREILGIDGAYIDKKILHISGDEFRAADLQQPIREERQFDLAVCLEVAEHIPAQFAATLVNSLTGLAPVVLFSASIPFQGGEGHCNEQWQPYWIKLFQERGYVAIDYIRRKIWDRNDIHYWYAQNVFLYVGGNCLEDYPVLKNEYEAGFSGPVSLVHPVKYLQAVELSDLTKRSIWEILAVLPVLIKNSLAKKMGRIFKR